MFSTIAWVFFFYILLAFFITKIIKNKPIPLSTKEVFLAFGLKVLLGCIYGYIFLHYYNGDDTWYLHERSKIEYNLLINDPLTFFSEYTPQSAFAKSNTFWEGVYYYIKDLEYFLIAKTFAFVNILSRGNYYINTVFFNFIVFWGHYWLFAVLQKEFPAKRTVLLIGIFFFPPTVFWLSGIRADGLLFFFMSLLFLHFHRWMQHRKNVALAMSFIAAIGIIIFRDAVMLLLLPALISWFVIVRWKRNPLWTFATVYMLSAILFFGSQIISSHNNLPAMVVNRQQQFLQLKGTAFPLDPLQPSIKSFAAVLPQAAGNTFLRPYLWEWKGALQLLAALEVLVMYILVFLIFFKPAGDRNEIYKHPLILSFIFFAVSWYVFIGYTVPFPGAIVRYRIIAELLLFLSIAIGINWKIPFKLK